VAPGMYYLNPEIDSLTCIDIREKVQPLAGQRVVTRDNIQLSIDSILFYKIKDSYKSQFKIQNLPASLSELASTALRNLVGKFTLQQLLQEKDELDTHLQAEVSKPTKDWGIKITRVLIQDLILPNDMRIQMSSAAVAKKIAESKIIAAQADVQSAKLMRDAADALSSQAAQQIRFLESLELITKKSKNPKLVFFPSKFTDLGDANDDIASEGKAQYQ